MKNIFLAGFLLLFATMGNSSMAQSTQGPIINYVVTTTKIQQLKLIFLAAESLAAEDGDSFGEFKILICGKAVEDLACSDTMAPYLKMAEKTGAKIIACEYSMTQIDIDTARLAKGIESVENAITENLQLQKKGYISLEL